MVKFMVLAQFLGFFAIFFWVISILFKNKSKILLSQIISNIFHIFEYLLLNGITAAITNLICLVRSIVFSIYDKQSKIILSVFLLITAALGIITYTNLFNLIPIILTLLYTLTLWQNNLLIIRINFIICGIIWIFYNINIQAYTSAIGNIFEILFGCYSIYKNK